MVVFPNCKINLGLRIVRKRNDGFHDLETIFYPVALYDALEVIRDNRSNPAEPALQFSSSGLSTGEPNNNLCTRAYLLLKKDHPQLPEIQMHLHKAIPIGAGLGGGSADAGFTLKLLNEKFNLGLTTNQLIQYAAQLGSDCPFFIINQPCFATGRGEVLEPLPLSLAGYKILIVNPGIHIDTAAAFASITPALPDNSVKEIIQQPVETWKNELINDFEKSIFDRHPEIENIKKTFYELGAIYASMSGSGSTVYGIFEKKKTTTFSFPPHYFIKELIS